MDWNRVEGNWKQFKGAAKEKWGKLTDDDLNVIEGRREQLEGKAYVERYVQTLTHELKSPLTAIRAAAELLHEDMPPEDRRRFAANVDNEAARLQSLADRLLHLAQLEQRRGLTDTAEIELEPLVMELLAAQEARALGAGVRLACAVPAGCHVRGERFLLRHALSNLLDNALDFTPAGGTVALGVDACTAALLTVRRPRHHVATVRQCSDSRITLCA